MKNYYEILEVHPKASDEVIKKVYKIKIKQNHPDLFKDKEKIRAEEITKDITEAYNILSDNEKRTNYDIELEKLEKENNNITKYENLISSLKSENKYLKQVIMSRDNVINNYINNDINPNYNPNVNYFFNKKNIGKEQNSNLSNENQEYFKSIIYDLKQLGVKLLFFLFLLLALLIFFSILTKNNIFTIFREIF